MAALRTVYRFVHDLGYAALLGAVDGFISMLLVAWIFVILLPLMMSEILHGDMDSWLPAPWAWVPGVLLEMCLIVGACLALTFGVLVGYHAAQKIGGGGLMGLAVGLTATVIELWRNSDRLATQPTSWSFYAEMSLLLTLSPVIGGLVFSHNWVKFSRIRRWIDRQAGPASVIPRLVGAGVLLFVALSVAFMVYFFFTELLHQE